MALLVLQSFDICGRVSAIRKALVMLCSSQVSLRLIKHHISDLTRAYVPVSVFASSAQNKSVWVYEFHEFFFVSFRVMECEQAVSSAARLATSVLFVRLISETR